MNMKIYRKLSLIINSFILGTFGLASILAEAKPNAWIDIPTKSLIIKGTVLGKDFKQFSILLDRYHSLDKKNLELIDTRINALTQIITQAKVIINNNDSKDTTNISLLIPIAEKKIWYLQEIKKIYKDKRAFEVFTKINENNKYQPVFLVNEVFFDFKLPTYWGLCYLEVLDPCHRMLTAHYIKWKESGSLVPFYLWLEDQEFPFWTWQIKFFSEQEIKDCELEILDDFFVKAVNKIVVNYIDDNKEYMYCITLDKKLIVTIAEGNIRHTSISRGKPVLGAGSLKIKGGKLVYIDNNSGHYRPVPEILCQVLMILKEKGAIINPEELQVMYYTERGKVLENAKRFIDKYKNFRSKIKNSKSKIFKI